MIIQKLNGKDWFLTTETDEDAEFKLYLENVFESIDILKGRKSAEIY